MFGVQTGIDGCLGGCRGRARKRSSVLDLSGDEEEVRGEGGRGLRPVSQGPSQLRVWYVVAVRACSVLTFFFSEKASREEVGGDHSGSGSGSECRHSE